MKIWREVPCSLIVNMGSQHCSLVMNSSPSLIFCIILEFLFFIGTAQTGQVNLGVTTTNPSREILSFILASRMYWAPSGLGGLHYAGFTGHVQA